MRNVGWAAIALIGLANPASPAWARDGDSVDWRQLATPADRVRLRKWRQAWIGALERARKDNAAALVAGGALFDPDRAFADAVPPVGRYRCRVFKLGAKGTAMAEFTRYGDFVCRVATDGEVVTLDKLQGPQRPVGVLFKDNPARAVFLGTMMIGDETRAIRYGRDQTRDLAGYVERIGDKRWRLVLPYPRMESILDVVELVPLP